MGLKLHLEGKRSSDKEIALELIRKLPDGVSLKEIIVQLSLAAEAAKSKEPPTEKEV